MVTEVLASSLATFPYLFVTGRRKSWSTLGMALADHDPDALSPLCPWTSTGTSAGRFGQPVILRGLQEVVERDAITRGWFGSYPLEEFDPEEVFRGLGAAVSSRFRRPNLAYRFFRVDTPFSAHVTFVMITGDDLEGPSLLSTGSACRQNRRSSWLKSLLEAVQGRHYVRFLMGQMTDSPPLRPLPPRSFKERMRHEHPHRTQ